MPDKHQIKFSRTIKTQHKLILCELINHFTPNGIGVEIGVNEGQTSYEILLKTSTKHLYSIDSWIPLKGWVGKDGCDHNYQQVCSFNKIFPGRSTTIRKKSEDATKDVPNNLDFIFIDGNHDYEYVKKDLEMWIPKIKSGGLISGHDWIKSYPGVIGAVTEYFKKHDCVLAPFNDDDLSQFKFIWKHCKAPAKDPVVNKSWPKGFVWWTIKK